MASKCHVRSISLPARSHPSTLKILEELNKLKTSTSGSICFGLSGLEDLYKRMDDLLNLTSTRKVLSGNQKYLDELLDGSVRLLDVCSVATDILLQIKEHVHALQSAFRRRKGDFSINREVEDYTCFRKKTKKTTKTLIAALKQMDNKLGTSPLIDGDQHLCSVIGVLREVNVMNSCIFQSLLFFLSTPSKPKQSRWSVVSKLMHKRREEYPDEQTKVNELEKLDSALIEGSDFKAANKRLETLENTIEELESCLGSVFRHLIKSRASLLNIPSQWNRP